MTDRLTGTTIALVTFLGAWVILVGFMPYEFYVGASATEYAGYNIPDYFNKQELEEIKYFINHTIEWHLYGYGTDYDFDAQGATGTYVMVNFWANYRTVWFNHEVYRIGPLKWHEEMWFAYPPYETVDITLDVAEAFWDESRNVSKLYPIAHAQELTVTAWILDHNTSRNNLTQAWQDGILDIGVGFGIDDAMIRYDTWTLIAQLLTFQAPQINPAINALIALPFWACTVIVIVLIISKFVPFGGG